MVSFIALVTILASLAVIVPVAIAQTGSQNASIPDCVRACDTLAIEASNCTAADQYCHCVRANVILDNIIPCVLAANSTCGANATDDLFLFEKLFAEVCVKFNVSVPTNFTGHTAPSPLPYTGAASAGIPVDVVRKWIGFISLACAFSMFI